MAETGQAELFVSWGEIYKPLDKLGEIRKKRLVRVAKQLPKVARIGEWQLGINVLGHSDSAEIEDTILKASRPDREQFLSYAALGLNFFVTKDKDYLKKSVRQKFIKQYGFQVGKPDECLGWIKKRGVY
jgi:hypothetical protein